MDWADPIKVKNSNNWSMSFESKCSFSAKLSIFIFFQNWCATVTFQLTEMRNGTCRLEGGGDNVKKPDICLPSVFPVLSLH